MGGWIVLRVATLMPEAESLELPGDVAEAVLAAKPDVGRPVFPEELVVAVAAVPSPAPTGLRALAAVPAASIVAERAVRADVRQDGDAAVAIAEDYRDPVIVPPNPPLRQASRWSASLWGAARGGGGSVADAGQLGGSQAGVRVRYAIDDARRLGLTARVATPIGARGADAAVGIDWRPVGPGVAVIVERRFGIDGAPGGTAAFVAGGFGPVPVGGGVVIEGYAQGGAVARDRIEPFADGAMRVARDVAKVAGVDVSAGLGAWGGAQRDVARFDIGPTIGAAVPVGDRRIRVAIDWRERIAGNAAPGSGPAFSIGADF